MKNIYHSQFKKICFLSRENNLTQTSIKEYIKNTSEINLLRPRTTVDIIQFGHNMYGNKKIGMTNYILRQLRDILQHIRFMCAIILLNVFQFKGSFVLKPCELKYKGAYYVLDWGVFLLWSELDLKKAWPLTIILKALKYFNLFWYILKIAVYFNPRVIQS